jgi:hypothetical protein
MDMFFHAMLEWIYDPIKERIGWFGAIIVSLGLVLSLMYLVVKFASSLIW